MKKLNLGCGSDYKEGWVNVDSDRGIRADLFWDLRKRFPFKDGEFDSILAQDVLEHFTKEEAKFFLKECRRVLKTGGEIKLRTPNIFKIYKVFKKDPQVLIKFLYGDTSRGEPFGSHKYAYTQKSLTRLLKRNYFKDIIAGDETTNLVCTAKKGQFTPKPIKTIISVLDSGGLGGAENFLIYLGKGLAKAGGRCLYYSVKKAPVTGLLEKNKLEHTSLPFRMDIIGDWKGFVKFFLLLAPAIVFNCAYLKRLKKRKFNSIILTGVTDKIILSPIAKLLEIAVIWIEFAPLATVFKKNFYLPKIFYRLVKDIPRLVIVPTINTKKHLIPETRISEAKIEVVPCGISITKRDFVHKPSPTKIIGMVSRIEKGKGQDTLIKAAKVLNSKFRILNFKIVIVGEGDTKQLKDLAEKLGVADKVIFTGFVDNPLGILGTFDIFAFPSRWPLEGFGLVLLEAMLARVPIVASNFGPIPEIVGDAGVLIEPTPEKLANAIYTLLKSPREMVDLIQKGSRRVKMFNIDKIVARYFEVMAES